MMPTIHDENTLCPAFMWNDKQVPSKSAQGQEGVNNHFHSRTILNDAATGAIWVENQVSLGAGETIMAKTCFEEWLWD